MSEPWAYIPEWDSSHGRCPCGEPGASVREGATGRCLSHGHQGLPEAMRWARAHNVRLVLDDSQKDWLEFQCDREGITLKGGWTWYDALDLLDGKS